MLDWTDEYNIHNTRGIRRHEGRNFEKWHIKIGSHRHITVNVPDDWVPEGPYHCP